MSSPRVLRPVEIGADVAGFLPMLRRALDGRGPALLPCIAAEGDRLRAALSADAPLGPDEDDPDDPTALVVGTSGSTGTPKGVLLSVSALRASAAATHERLGGPGTWVLAVPAHHVAGLQVLVRSLLAGTSPVVVDTASGFRADTFAAAVRDLPGSGPRYTSLVPTQLRRLLDDAVGVAALRGLDAVLLGGAATPAALLGEASDAGVRVVRTYGMSETAGGCVYDGVGLRGVSVRIGAEVGAGPIHLAGPMLARGYRGLRSTAFRDGWFHTGDLGRIRPDGRLEVLGRVDDMIISGGVNIHPAPVERALTEIDGISEACVVGLDDPEWGQIVTAAIVPTVAGAPPEEQRIREAVRAAAGAAAVPKRLLVLDGFPLRGPGKVDRAAVAALLRER